MPRCERVVDGDTVDLRFASGVERVRLLGIDTPETVKPNTPVQCFGPEASARTKALLPPGTERSCDTGHRARDRYGRLLLYIYRAADGMFVNRTLVAEGYARILSIAPNTAHAPELSAAAAAPPNGPGGACGLAAPSHGLPELSRSSLLRDPARRWVATSVPGFVRR